VDSGSQSFSHKDSDVFFHIGAGGNENKESASDNVQISKRTYNTYVESWSEEEKDGEGAEEEEDEEVLARMKRSSEDFDDDVENSSSEEERHSRGNSKGPVNSKGQGQGKGQGKERGH
jgi:hypothetical protein